MAFNSKGVDVGICTTEEHMGPCVNVRGVAYRTRNGWKRNGTKEQLFASITHILIISKFEKAGNLGIGNFWVYPKISTCRIVNFAIKCQFSYTWKGISKCLKVEFLVTLFNVFMEAADGAFVRSLHHRMPPIFV
jgi:hypothetical protein